MRSPSAKRQPKRRRGRQPPCPACLIRADQIPVNRQDSSEPEDWRADADGQARYRGTGRQGAPTVAANDDMDLVTAVKTLERGRHAVKYARSPEVMELGTIQRKAALREAMGLIALAARTLMSVVERSRVI